MISSITIKQYDLYQKNFLVLKILVDIYQNPW